MDELESAHRNDELIDLETFGGLVRSLRKRSGYDSVSRMVYELKKLGLDVTTDTIYAIEQGRQPVRLDLYLAIMYLCSPRDGHAWFASAYRSDIRDWMLR